MADARLDWMVGVVPVAIGAVTTLHLSQLLRIQPAASAIWGGSRWSPAPRWRF